MRAYFATELERARRVLPALPRLVGEPAARARLLSELTPVWIALGVLIVLGVWVLPLVTGFLADLVFPAEEVSRGFFSRRKSVTHPLRDPTEILLLCAGWGYGLWLTASLFLRACERALGAPDPEASSMEATLISGARTMAVSARSLVEVSKGALKGALKGAGLDDSTDAGSRYSLRGELGRGAMGIVHLAEDTVLGREVALKELPAHLMGSKELYERFRVEARALARLSHPGIVQVYDLVQGPSGSFMAMELVRGGSLDERLVEGRPMAIGEAARLGVALARALEHAHASGVIHRDFKPQNVLMTEAGEPKVTDFGLAKMQEGPKLTRAGAMMGSPAYMSPEQATGGPTDGKTDVYSLGITLFQMLTGRLPFEESGPALFMAHLQSEPPRLDALNPEAPPALAELVEAMLAKAPEARPELGHVAEVLEGLRVAASRGVEGAPPSAT